ncbi:MAG: hypothetical protein H7X92_09225 [Chitinophagales bacterium]|nr:hypothetical protein [Hyphomicrobiales bacterium]
MLKAAVPQVVEQGLRAAALHQVNKAVRQRLGPPRAKMTEAIQLEAAQQRPIKIIGPKATQANVAAPKSKALE